MPRPKKTKPLPAANAFNPVDKALLHSVMLELGIAPMIDPLHDMRRGITQLSAEDNRATKRKFRKLWRKAMRQKLLDTKSPAAQKLLQTKLGSGVANPTSAQRLERKRLVMGQIWAQYVVPMLDNFEKQGNK